MAYTQSNEIKTRISLKYDSLSNWESKNPLLLAGEVAIAYLASSQTTTTPDNDTHPVMFKVGPGNFNALPWTSALAADVYGWAKAKEVMLDKTNEKLQFKNASGVVIKEVDLSYFASDAGLEALAAEVEALSGRVDVADTDTKYNFTVNANGDLVIQATDKAGDNVGDAITVPICSSDELNAILDGYVTKAVYDVDKAALEGSIADVDGKFANYTTTEDMNKEFAKYTKTADLDGKITELNYIKSGAVDTKISTALESYYDKGEIDGKVNTINGAIDGINANFANYDTKTEVNTKISDALKSYYNKGEVDGLIADLATAMNFVGVVESLPDSANDGDVVVLKSATGTQEYVWYDGKWELLGDESLLGQVASDLEIAEGKIAELEGTVGGHTTTLGEHLAAIQANAKAIADNETDIEGKFSTLNDTVEGHTTTLGQHLEAINKNKADIEALPASIAISSTAEAGKYVSAISGNAKDGFTVSKAELPTLGAVAVAPQDAASTGEALTATVLTAVKDNGTSGHDVKLKTEAVSVATTKGAEKAAADAVTNFAANMVESGEGKFVTGMTKSGNNISFTKGDVYVSDLKQTANTYVWFNCGSASEVI